MDAYVPQQGDFIVVTLDPQAGHEQRGRRPALVVSNDVFNRRTGFAMVCPVTTRERKVRFHVAIPEDGGVTGFIMVEQLKSLDFRARDATWVAAADEDTVEEVLAILEAFLA